MGNGISKTYPNGILKAPPRHVHFGRPEVRTYRQDSWETKPLLNTHEVARLEAKIRAAPMQSAKPIPIRSMPAKRTNPVDKFILRATIVGGIAAVVCVFAGPFALIIPAAALLIWGAVAILTKKPRISNEQLQAANKSILHLEKLVRKHENAGLYVQASIYKEMLRDYRNKYGI